MACPQHYQSLLEDVNLMLKNISHSYVGGTVPPPHSVESGGDDPPHNKLWGGRVPPVPPARYAHDYINISC